MAKFNHILLVEDDIFIAELYQRAFSRAGYQITVAKNGEAALDEAKTGKYDLILLDIMIPKSTGIEVINKLRSAGKSPNENMKIVITTNLELEGDDRSNIEKLADGYIIKSDITPKNLIEMVEKLK